MALLHVLHLGLFTAPLLLALWGLRGPLRHSPVPALIAILYFGALAAGSAVGNVRAPHEWDYACFWLYGHIAAAHQNLYDPAVFAHFASPFTPSAEFVQAVINVGFPYPPPTIALFLPLGYIDSVPTGLAVWYIVQFAALIAAAWVLARTFMPATPWSATALIAGIVLALPATGANVYDAQTNFLVLLLIALALAGRASAIGGVWEMLAIWIKPYTGVLLLLDLARGSWRKVAAAALTAIVSLIAAAVVLGPQAILSYIRSGPAGREPAFAFVENTNQSLLAVILRRQHFAADHVSILHEPIYIALSLVLFAITALLCVRAPRNSDLAFVLCLLLGMLIYPATLFSYGVVLIAPLLVLWRHRDELPGQGATAVALVALVTIVQSREVVAFVATLALWLVVAFLLAVPVRNREPAFAPIEPEPVVAG